MADDQIDPRYDPSFQRGFSGERVGRRDDADAPPRVITDDSVAAAPVPAPEPDPSPTPAAVEVAAVSGSGLRRNPFVWVLVVIGVVLVLAGILLIRGVVAVESTGTPTADDLVALQTGEIAGPAVLFLGGATLIGVLFLFAVERWRK